MKNFKVKKLKWKIVKPEAFEKEAHNAVINHLTMVSDFDEKKPAYYQVAELDYSSPYFNDSIKASFWCHNRALIIKNVDSIEEGKKVCQQHYEKIIFENIDID